MSPPRWNTVHAVLCLVTGAWSVAASSTWPLAVAGTGSLLVFFVFARTPQRRLGGLGVANALTLLRLLLLFGVAARFPTAWGFALVLVLDGVDGLLARRLDESSTFGAQLDMETDALFTALLSVVLAPASPWILIAGALRPLLVLARAFLREQGPEPRVPLARYAFGAAAWSMVAALLAARPEPLTGFATLVLLISFSGDFRRLRP